MTSQDTRIRRMRDPFSVSLARNLFGLDPFFGYEANASKPSFVPAFEVREGHTSYIVKADLPGVKEGDIDISLHNNVLTVSGTRIAEESKEGDTYFVYERQYGNFSRSFSLPDEANAEEVAAVFKDGVLTVSIAKRAESRPRKIAIK